MHRSLSIFGKTPFFKVAAVAAAFVMFGQSSIAQDLPDMDVTVKFAPRVEKDIHRVDQFERRQEARLRGYSIGSVPEGEASTRRHAHLIEAYAVERMIPDLADFSIVNLGERMAAYNLAISDNIRNGYRLVIQIDDFYLANYSVARFRGHVNRMRGSVSLYDDKGALVRSEEVSTFRKPLTQFHRDFDGPGHPFPNTNLPFLLATFIEKGMSKVYENQTMPQVVLASFVKNGD